MVLSCTFTYGCILKWVYLALPNRCVNRTFLSQILLLPLNLFSCDVSSVLKLQFISLTL